MPPEPLAAGEYHFTTNHSDGAPVGWDPCRPIPYWIGQANLPVGGRDLIVWVLAEVTSISGQEFDFRGYSAELPTDTDRFPVSGLWIGWSTEATTDIWRGHELNGPDPAIGLASAINPVEGSITRGWATLRSSYNPRADAAAGGVLRHEIGHALGLAHTMSLEEVMSPGGGRVVWGLGDRRGLWLLGVAQGCPS